MAVGTGYSKIVTSGSVFMYDTGDTYNSYIGEPTTNYWDAVQYSIYNDGATNIRNSTDVLPPIPGYEVVKVTANNIGTYGQSILWKAPYPNNNVSIITNSVYAYLTVGNYVQVGQHWYPWYYGEPTYISKNQWVRISSTYTINEGNSYGVAALTYSTNGIAYFAMPQFEYKTHVTPFIGANQTRSGTQGLIDISGNEVIPDISSISYNNSAMFYFDGTDDQIIMDSYASKIPYGGNITVESVVKFNAFSPNDVIVAYGGNNTNFGWLHQYEFTAGLMFGIQNNPNYGTAGIGTSASQQYLNQYIHMVGVYNGSQVLLYINNVLVASQSYSSGIPQATTFRIGNESGRSYYSNMYLPVTKIYNRALSQSEIQQNYLHYKTRFNLA